MTKKTGRTRKKAHQKAAVVAVSMPQFMLDLAGDRAHARGFNAFSAYIQELVRRDIFPSERAA